jgi:hypothetical protein
MSLLFCIRNANNYCWHNGVILWLNQKGRTSFDVLLITRQGGGVNSEFIVVQTAKVSDDYFFRSDLSINTTNIAKAIISINA